MEARNKGQKRKPIVLYDGKCRFCTVSKNFAEKNTENTYIFVDYHSNEGRKMSDTLHLTPENTVYVIDGDSIKQKSEASLSVLENMQWWGRFLAVLGRMFPRSFSDFIYDIVAKHRS